MKLLIGASSSKIFHLKEFADALEKLDVQVKLVKDTDYSKGFPSKKVSEWFNGDQKFKELNSANINTIQKGEGSDIWFGSDRGLGFIRGGLKDLSISRKSFSWGIKVPNNKEHVIYVWLDALTNYISALNYPNTNDPLFKKYWPASIHLIGKDILRFHAVYWPAFLLAAKIPLPKNIYGHGWILSGDEKMSLSLIHI